MKSVLILIATTLALALALAGCASQGDYKQYLDAKTRMDAASHAATSAESVAKYNAEAEKYKAMAAIAASGSETAKVAAVVAMIGMNSNNQSLNTLQLPQNVVQPPPQNEALQWASILVPSVTNVIGMGYNYKAAVTQSNNARDVAISTNSTFSSMGTNIQNTSTSSAASIASVAASNGSALTTVAGMIQAPQANVTTTISGDGVVGSGTLTKSPVSTTTTSTTSTTDNHAATTTTTTNPTTVTPAGKVCAIDAAGVLTCN